MGAVGGGRSVFACLGLILVLSVASQAGGGVSGRAESVAPMAPAPGATVRGPEVIFTIRAPENLSYGVAYLFVGPRGSIPVRPPSDPKTRAEDVKVNGASGSCAAISQDNYRSPNELTCTITMEKPGSGSYEWYAIWELWTGSSQQPIKIDGPFYFQLDFPRQCTQHKEKVVVSPSVAKRGATVRVRGSGFVPGLRLWAFPWGNDPKAHGAPYSAPKSTRLGELNVATKHLIASPKGSFDVRFRTARQVTFNPQTWYFIGFQNLSRLCYQPSNSFRYLRVGYDALSFYP